MLSPSKYGYWEIFNDNLFPSWSGPPPLESGHQRNPITSTVSNNANITIMYITNFCIDDICLLFTPSKYGNCLGLNDNLPPSWSGPPPLESCHQWNPITSTVSNNANKTIMYNTNFQIDDTIVFPIPKLVKQYINNMPHHTFWWRNKASNITHQKLWLTSWP
jgi:hypothetical protein